MSALVDGVLVTLDGNTQSVETLLASYLPSKLVYSLNVAGNTADVLIGKSTLTATTNAITKSPAGGSITISAPLGAWFDISRLYIKGTNNDTVYLSFVC